MGGKKISVQFKEYLVPVTGLSQAANSKNIRFVPNKKISTLIKSKPNCQKWIYVFRECGSQIYWYSEIYADATGKYQTTDVVKEGRQASDKRALMPKKSTTIELLADVTNYIFLSQIQLSFKRIRGIRKKLEKGHHSRVQKVEFQSSSSCVTVSSPTQATVYLADHLEIARILNSCYIKKRDHYLTWANNKDRNLMKTLNDIVLGVTGDNKDLLKCLRGNGSDAKYWKRNYLRDEDSKIKAYERFAAAIVRWIDQDSFWSVLTDYDRGDDVTKELGEYKFWQAINRINETNPGRLFFKTIYQKQSSWLNTSVFAGGRKASGAFTNIVEALATTIIKVKGKKAIFVIQEIFQMRDIILDLRTKTLFRQTTTIKKTTTIEVTILEIKVKPGKKWAESLSEARATKALKDVIEIINLAFSIQALYNSKGTVDITKNSIVLGGAVIDVVAGMSIFAKAVSKRSAAVLGIVSGTIDAVVGVWDTVTNIQEGDYDAAIGYGAVAVGGVVTAIGSYMVFVALGTSATGVGIVPGIIIGVIGAIISGVGWLIAAFSDDSDVEMWLKNCHWGVDGNKPISAERDWAGGSFRKWKGDYLLQIKSFYNALYSFELETNYGTKYQSENILEVKIKPSPALEALFHQRGMVDYENFKIDLWLGYGKRKIYFREASGKFIEGKPLNRFYAHKEESYEKGKFVIKSIDVFFKDPDKRTRIIGLSVPNMVTKLEQRGNYKCYCAVRLDMYNNGKLLVPSQGAKIAEISIPSSWSLW